LTSPAALLEAGARRPTTANAFGASDESVINICDTGPLVAYLNRNDPHHDWAVSLMKQLPPPLLTCEPVLTEAIYFLREDRAKVSPLFAMLERGAVQLAFSLSSHWPRVRVLMSRYDRMDLADAALVAMSELHANCRVLTVDRRDFSTYRRNDRQTIDFVAPPAR
jgi:predicted nucleic acid-binding protein